MMEIPVVFGEEKNLFGIINQPHQDSTNAVGVIMLTAGMLHHVGSYRFHVLLGRRLEHYGIPSLRFDLSGIGESLPGGKKHDSLHRAATEAEAAMEHLRQEYGVSRFILFGLCSGADDGWFTAYHNESVVGLVMIDGCGYPTKRFQQVKLRSFLTQRLLSPYYWFAWARRRMSERNVAPATLPFGDDIREFPDRKEAVHQLRLLMERDVRLLCCYTSGARDYFNHRQQFQEMFAEVDLQDRVDVEHYPIMDHVSILKEDRQVLLDRIADWICKQSERLESTGPLNASLESVG
jgi:pimeloyl-ACP methyl ester carboxylesterase